jgi:hypothetical protein
LPFRTGLCARTWAPGHRRPRRRRTRATQRPSLAPGPTRSRAASAASDPTIQGTERPRRLDDLTDDRRDDNPGDEIGEAVGGISGVLTGAALGSLGGPIGTIIGGIAGAVSGWWAGKAISEAASHVTHDDEAYYRTHYEALPDRPADRSYDDVRPAYQIGHLAGRNPEYHGRSFEEVESDLQRGWSGDVSARHGDWQQVRHYARNAYERGRSSFGTGAVPGSATSSATTGGAGVASGAAMGAAGGLGGTVDDTWDRAKAGAANLADRAADRVDDLKDRVDANPASRPGLDATDRSGYGTTMGAENLSSPSTPGSVDRPGLGDDARRAGERVENAADRLGDRAEHAWDRTKEGARNLADKVTDKLDDVKDRVDGNPSSRPGPDATDRRF